MRRVNWFPPWLRSRDTNPSTPRSFAHYDPKYGASPDASPIDHSGPTKRERDVSYGGEAVVTRKSAPRSHQRQTVESHRRNVMHKLGLKSTAELVRYAVRDGLVQP